MKYILFLVAVLSASAAFACKPAPLPVCEASPLLMKRKAAEILAVKVGQYQRLLTKGIILPELRTSCFNNHFASFYTSQFIEQLKKRKSQSCPHQTAFLKEQILRFIETNTPEIQTVKNKKILRELARLRKIIKAEAHKLL